MLQLCVGSKCDLVGIQENCRTRQGVFSDAGYVVHWSGVLDGSMDKNGVHGVGFAIEQSIVNGVDKGGTTVACIRAQLMKVRLYPHWFE